MPAFDILPPSRPKTLRQFAALWLVSFVALGAWRAWHGRPDAVAVALAAAGAGVGLAGLARPAIVAPIYRGWMVLVFPIRWTVSWIAMGAAFHLVFTPVALLFRLIGRDALGLRRRTATSYWQPKPAARSPRDYLRPF